MITHPVWDAPTRFIHWCFPIGVGLMWWTGETGRMELHSYVAYVLLTLVTARLALGFVGSYHSRFRNFVVSKCRDNGLNLSAAETDLIDAWFAGTPRADQGDTVPAPSETQPQQAPAAIPQQAEAVPSQDMTADGRSDWLQPTAAPAAQQPVQQQPLANAVTQRVQAAPAPAAQPIAAGQPVANEEDFPRIIRNRLRG